MSVATLLPPVYRLSLADWMRFPHDGQLYEIIGGECYVTPPPSIRHQRVSRNLEFHLVTFLRKEVLGEVLYAPVGVRISDGDIVEPDLVVVLQDHAHRVREMVVDAPPDLVVEILSPGTAGRDLGLKKHLYEAAGVPEYWIVDAEARAVDVLVLDGGRYARFGLFRTADTLKSQVLPGLEISLGDVFPQD